MMKKAVETRGGAVQGAGTPARAVEGGTALYKNFSWNFRCVGLSRKFLQGVLQSETYICITSETQAYVSPEAEAALRENS